MTVKIFYIYDLFTENKRDMAVPIQDVPSTEITLQEGQWICLITETEQLSFWQIVITVFINHKSILWLHTYKLYYIIDMIPFLTSNMVNSNNYFKSLVAEILILVYVWILILITMTYLNVDWWNNTLPY